MKIKLKLFLALFAFVATTIAMNAQTVSGTVLDSDNFPIANAEVKVKGSDASTVTDEDGKFTLDVPAGQGELEIFTINGTQSVGYNAGSGEEVAVGEINMEPSLNEIVVVGKGIIDVEEDRKTPVAVSTIFKEEIQEKAQGNVEFPEVLSNTPSVYVSNQSGGFGDSQMFTRGFDQTNTAFLLNGQPINGMEDGRMYWSNWSGMTEIANAVQIQRGLGSSKLAISSVGGTVNIITKSTEKRKGGTFQGIVGNDSYFKLGAGYDTGISDKGWAFSISLSYWSAYRKWAQGTKGEGQNYFLSVGKKINDRNTLNFLITGAPQFHDQNFTKGLDAYREYTTKYNSNYGFLNGDYMTWRRNYYHKPVMNLNWDFDINERMNLSSVMYASFGRGGGTGNYGRSSFTTNLLDINGHADFNAVVANNEINNFVVGDQENIGKYGSSSAGSGAIRSSVNNHLWWGNVTNFNMQINENLNFNIGADFRSYKGDHFRQLIDLLGLNGWNDTNGFRDADYVVNQTFKADPWAALSKYAKEDERIAYDYSEKINYLGTFGQIEYATDKFSVFFQGSFSSQNYTREDRWNKLSDISIVNETTGQTEILNYGQKSPKVSKTGYNVKGGFAYNINESNTVFFNAGHYSRQPFLDNIFSGSRQLYDSNGNYIRSINDNTALRSPEVENEKITGLELGYKLEKNNVRLNVNIYNTKWDNRFLDVYSRRDAFYGENVNYLISGINQLHKGIELDFNVKANSKLEIHSVFTLGDWNYEGTAKYDVRKENDFTFAATNLEANFDKVRIGYAPQFNFGLGYKYKFTRNFSWDLDFNFYARRYGDISILNLVKANQDGTQYQPEELAPFALANTGVTYKFKLGSQNLKFRANVYNLFNSPYLSQADSYGYAVGNGRTWNMGVIANF